MKLQELSMEELDKKLQELKEKYDMYVKGLNGKYPYSLTDYVALAVIRFEILQLLIPFFPTFSLASHRFYPPTEVKTNEKFIDFGLLQRIGCLTAHKIDGEEFNINDCGVFNFTYDLVKTMDKWQEEFFWGCTNNDGQLIKMDLEGEIFQGGLYIKLHVTPVSVAELITTIEIAKAFIGKINDKIKNWDGFTQKRVYLIDTVKELL